MSDLKITSVSFPMALWRKLKSRAKEEGFENSVSSFLAKLIRADIKQAEKEKEKEAA